MFAADMHLLLFVIECQYRLEMHLGAAAAAAAAAAWFSD